MGFVGQIYSFSQWLLVSEDLNFLSADVQIVRDKLLIETSERRYFLFLKGSERKSPRFRSEVGNCIILQIVGEKRYLARAVGSKAAPTATSCNDDTNRLRKCNRQVSKSVKFVVLDESLHHSQNSKVVFEWTLTRGQRNVEVAHGIETGPSYSPTGSGIASARKDSSTTSEFVWGPAVHFESYVSCRKNFVIVVGPPCWNDAQERQTKEDESGAESLCQPSNFIFNANDYSMKVLRLRSSYGSAGDQAKLWSANVAFDPRSHREHVAAIVACADAYNYLPRSQQTGSLLLLDVLRHKVLHVMKDRLCFSTDLQYTCTGEQLLTSLSHSDVITSRPTTSVPGDVISSERRPLLFALLSADDLSLLRILSLLPTCSGPTSVLSSVMSRDFKSFALFLGNSRVRVGSNTANAASLHDSCPIDVANFSFPAEIDSLFSLCLGVVKELLPRKEMIDSLLIPKVVASRLKEL